MKLITRPVIIESLEWSWRDGWTCHWKPYVRARGVADGGGVIMFVLSGRRLFRYLNYLTEPVPLPVAPSPRSPEATTQDTP